MYRTISEMTGKHIFPVTPPDPKRPLPSCRVGVEVELEDVPYETISHWDITGDGSLFSGVEYVSKPMGGKAIQASLNSLGAQLKKCKPKPSFRTSVHVHIDMLEENYTSIKRMLELYLTYESTLFRLHDEWNRYENIFCTPAYKSFEILNGYAHLLDNLKRGRFGTAHFVPYKYAALNPNSLTNFGTLEFRHMGGVTSIDEISDWINILLQMKKTALDPSIDIFNFEAVFGEYCELLEFTENDAIRGQEALSIFKHYGV